MICVEGICILRVWFLNAGCAVFNKVFKFRHLDVLNSQLLVKKWNGRVFNKGGNLMVNPDVF
jgi:hypothetical protein